MPELAEVEIVRRNIKAWWKTPADEVVWIDSSFGDQQESLETALKSKPLAFIRRGKHLVVQTEKGGVYFHLRMTGKIISAKQPDVRFARLAFKVNPGRITDGDVYPWLVFVDSRRLGSIDFLEGNALPKGFESLGPEPDAISVDYFEKHIGKKRGLKSALLDQKVVAGIGNIAITELFWIYKIAPNAKWSDLSTDQKKELCSGLAPYFDALIEKEDSAEIPYANEKGAPNPFLIYKRLGEPCPTCQTAIERTKIAGRSTYFCPTCQLDRSKSPI